MGVAGQLQIDWISPHSIGKVWLMNKQNGGLTAGNRPQRFIEAWLTLKYIVHAGYPESNSGAFYVMGRNSSRRRSRGFPVIEL